MARRSRTSKFHANSQKGQKKGKKRAKKGQKKIIAMLAMTTCHTNATNWHADHVQASFVPTRKKGKKRQKKGKKGKKKGKKKIITGQNGILARILLYKIACGARAPTRRQADLGNRTRQGTDNMTKQSTIAATMRLFMESGPSVTDFPNYKALNDHVGQVHGLAAGKCQALAGPKAWAWFADTTTGKWRPATPEEAKAKQEAAAGKNNGGTRKAKVMGDAERATLDAQVAALEAVNNPALAGLLAGLKAQQASDDQARKGTLKDRLAAAIDKLGLEAAVALLEAAEAEAAAAEDAEAAEDA